MGIESSSQKQDPRETLATALRPRELHDAMKTFDPSKEVRNMVDAYDPDRGQSLETFTKSADEMIDAFANEVYAAAGDRPEVLFLAFNRILGMADHAADVAGDTYQRATRARFEADIRTRIIDALRRQCEEQPLEEFEQYLLKLSEFDADQLMGNTDDAPTWVKEVLEDL